MCVDDVSVMMMMMIESVEFCVFDFLYLLCEYVKWSDGVFVDDVLMVYGYV